MSVSPAWRLVRLGAAWTAAAVLVVVWPVLVPAAWAALLALAVVAAADLVRLLARSPLATERIVPERAVVGRPGSLVVRVLNPSGSVRRCSLIFELPADVSADEPVVPALRVAPHAMASVVIALLPTRRGDRPLGPTIAFEASALGLWRRRTVASTGQVLRVYPDTRHLHPSGTLDPGRVLAALGVKPARRRGDGLELDSLRDYAPGDDPRRLDWAASARRGRPVVRVLRHEQHHQLLLALDTSRLMGGRVDGRTKLDHAIDAALALALGALDAGDRVGIVVFDRTVRAYLAPRAMRQAIGGVLEALRPLEPSRVEADYVVLAREIAARQRQRALVVVLTDFVEASGADVAAPLTVLGRKHRVLLVALRDPAFAALDAGASDPRPGPLPPLERIALDDLLREREATLGALREAGVKTLDLAPEAVTTSVLGRYLEIRHGPG